jgi:hypothetical protein
LRILPQESRRRGAHHHRAAGRDFQHRQAALGGAVGLEAEDAIDTRESVGVHQGAAGKAVIGLALRQQGHQRHRVIGKAGQLRRRCAKGGAVLADKIRIRIGRGRGVPAALKAGLAH